MIVIRAKRLSIHVFKILIGIILGYMASRISPHLMISWILISVFLILSPEEGDAMELAVTRIKANLIGACTGFSLVVFEFPLIVSMILGSMTALIVCEVIGLNVGARATLTAMVVVLMDHGHKFVFDTAFHRVISVFLGCIIGLFITYFVHSVLKLKTPKEITHVGDSEKES